MHSNICIPRCPQGCLHGDCTAPGVCKCHSGQSFLLELLFNKCDNYWFPPRVVTDRCQGDYVSEMMAYLKVLSHLLSEVTEEQLQRADTGNLSNNKLA